MFTDEELVEIQRDVATDKFKELARLARIGLECRNLARRLHTEHGFDDVDFFAALTSHPAWRDK